MFFLQICSKTFLQNFLYTLFLFHQLVFSDPPYRICSEKADNNSPFQNNLNNFYNSLSSNASVSNFYNTSIGHGPDTVYGLFLCYKYVSQDDCEICINSASEDMQRLCPNTNEAVLWQDSCLLRYSNQNFFGQLDVTGNVPLYNKQTVSEPERFETIVNKTVHNISSLAAFNHSYGMYATTDGPFSDTETIYALVQCTIDLSPDECNICLETAISNISSNSSYRGARLLSRSCYLRYEFYAFYEGATEPSGSTSNQDSGGHKGIWLIVVLGVGSAILVGVILGLCLYCLARRNQTNKNTKSGQEVEINNAGGPNDMDYLNQNLQGTYNLNPQELPFIDMENINEATDNFSDSNKLGQGGFGPVYKGVMPNGEEVAVKRLSICSEQGLDEFVNEVVLILKLQHKNLVRLLGFCIHQEEKLLIYEFMPNTSLDVFLIDCRKRAQLNWRKRLNIITGIARGMLYLHQDSRLRIIHRDLKPSNVLLDKDMNPKISDFGMARIFGGTDVEANTAKIVGTYGYMAPEFAMEGLYSVKSDVFSFGVLLLELITGRRNAGFHLSKLAPSLIAYAWKMWNDGKGVELIDPLLSDSYCVDEYLRCLHIGLLCVQEDAYDRPTMSSVVVMLNSETTSLSQPQRPANSIGKFTDHHETCYNNLSINNLTMSDIAPR